MGIELWDVRLSVRSKAQESTPRPRSGSHVGLEKPDFIETRRVGLNASPKSAHTGSLNPREVMRWTVERD